MNGPASQIFSLSHVQWQQSDWSPSPPPCRSAPPPAACERPWRCSTVPTARARWPSSPARTTVSTWCAAVWPTRPTWTPSGTTFWVRSRCVRVCFWTEANLCTIQTWFDKEAEYIYTTGLSAVCRRWGPLFTQNIRMRPSNLICYRVPYISIHFFYFFLPWRSWNNSVT